MKRIIESLRAVIEECGQLVKTSHTELFSANKLVSIYKDNDTPVTRLDCKINDVMMHWAKENNLGYVGEEGNGPTDAEYVLYVDPLDGTEAFLRGMNTSTIIASILHMKDGYGTPEVSIIHQPLGNRTWIGTANKPTRFYQNDSVYGNEISCTSAHDQKIKTAICVFPGASHHIKEVSGVIISDSNFDDQQMGGFGIGGALVASSLIHATAIASTAATEAAAMMLIVKGAEGKAYDLLGRPIVSFKFGEVRGKPDFILPDGALFTTDQTIAELVLKIISDCN